MTKRVALTDADRAHVSVFGDRALKRCQKLCRERLPSALTRLPNVFGHVVCVHVSPPGVDPGRAFGRYWQGGGRAVFCV